MTLSYLVSTAGHAQQQNDENAHDIRSILQLIEDGAEELGDEKVVGFTTISGSGAWTCDRYSFKELLSLTDRMAAALSERGVPTLTGQEQKIVSLLCPTGLDFLVTWIALMRMGYAVVLVAPQCSASAINSLYRTTQSTRLIHHPKYEQQATEVVHLEASTTLTELPIIATLPSSSSSTLPKSSDIIRDGSLSHIFHSSGTSGNPKPIPHTHRRVVSALPRRALPAYIQLSSKLTPAEPAAFTSTPLFHGGVSDLLRAWMARSMIYFYPTSEVPVTAQNLVSAVKACQGTPQPLPTQLTEDQLNERAGRFRVTAFLSVPYILSILAENPQGPGVEMLRSMDYVSTGGAPLDPQIGDKMVEEGVKLVSRLGSSECGFLLTSHRDYETEKDWQWLRNNSDFRDELKFEEVEGGVNRFEMVVGKDWQSKTKSNRNDGSYATGDLYEPHPSKADVWRYVGRGDDVIVLSNGEKASPAHVEAVFQSSSLFLDALVVGSDRTQLGMLLFPNSSQDQIDETSLSSLLAQANAASPSFAQISQEMCLVIRGTDKTLPKSSKGTVQRGVAYEVFKDEIASLYAQDRHSSEVTKRTLPEIKTYLQGLITEIGDPAGRRGGLDSETDLFSWGVDSLMATKIRNRIIRTLNTGGQTLSTNIVFERPSIERLSQYICGLQERTHTQTNAGEDGLDLMRAMAEKYGSFAPTSKDDQPLRRRGGTYVLTGATGSLGVFLLAQLSALPAEVVERIVCLVRAEDDRAAQARVKELLNRRGLTVDPGRFVTYASNTSKADLGLDAGVLETLQNEVEVVIHAAWPVHFASHLVSFEDSIRGARNLIDFVSHARSSAHLYFCSSLASVLAQKSSHVYETPTNDPSTASSIGYSQSKWVTENVCEKAHQAGLDVSVLRVGQLCGDTISGYWNEKEGWPLLIRTAQTTGCLPVLREEPSWLPVDLASQAIVDIVSGSEQASFISHIAHPYRIQWSTILDGVQEAGLHFKRVEPRVWLDKVEACSELDPSKRMLSLWRAAYGGDSAPRDVKVDVSNAQRASRTLRDIAEVDTAHIGRMVAAWKATGYLS